MYRDAPHGTVLEGPPSHTVTSTDWPSTFFTSTVDGCGHSTKAAASASAITAASAEARYRFTPMILAARGRLRGRLSQMMRASGLVYGYWLGPRSRRQPRLGRREETDAFPGCYPVPTAASEPSMLIASPSDEVREEQHN